MMCRRLCRHPRLIALLLCLASVSISLAQGINGSVGPLTDKEVLQSHVVGQTVVVRRLDGSKVRAKIVRVGDAAVVLRSGKGGNVEIAYKDIAKVDNGGLSRGAKGWIIGGAILLLLGIVGTRV